MKLTLNRRRSEVAENSTHYFGNLDLRALPTGSVRHYLDVDLEATPEERLLIENNGWGSMPLCKGALPGVGPRIDFELNDVLSSMKMGFDSFDNLAVVEHQLVESVRKVNQLLSDFAAGMPDLARRLAELYQRVGEEELGFIAEISDDGDVLFEHPDLGGLFISLNAIRDPEYMRLMLPAFFNATHGVSRHELVQICNRINSTAKLTMLTVREDPDGSVVAQVGLLLAAPDTRPTETLIRGVIRRAMSSIEGAAKLFAAEIEKSGSR